MKGKNVMKKRLLAIIMMLVLVMTSSSIVYAAESAPQTKQAEEPGISIVQVNPAYESEIDIEQIIEILEVYEAEPASSEEYTSDTSQIVSAFREQMLAREATGVFYYRTSEYENTQSWLRTLIRDWFEAACEETDNPRAGDFLRYSVSGYSVSTSRFESGNDTCLKLTITVRYYTTKEQEDLLSARIEEVLNQLNIKNLPSEFEKVSAIYDYICENITYDYDNLYDEDYLLKYSAYAAMVNKTAVCQGYATLFYTMAEQVGLDARVITGQSGGVNHAWNIVKIGDYYYYLDPTWDAGQEKYSYYLKCEENFEGHDIGEDFLTDEFRQKYPIGSADYNLCENHTEVWDPEVEPACTINGLTAGSHCSKCGVIIIAQTVLPASGHNVVVDQSVAASCTRTGLTEGSHCSVCEQVIVKQETIPKTGHKYDELVQDGSITVYRYICRLCSDSYDEIVDGYRVYGSNRYQTSFAIADALKADIGIQQYGSIIIASGTGFPDALAGSYLASVVGAPILMSDPTGANAEDLLSYVQENMFPDGQVYILGGTGAVPAIVENTLKSSGYNVKRLSGKDRYATNIKILEESIDKGGNMSELLICTGNNFADSLSASVTGLPILLVNNNTGKLTTEQLNFLNISNDLIDICYIIGGTGAVPESLQNAMELYGDTERIKGKNRYATSAAIASKFMPGAEVAIVVSGQNFPDGLCGGPLGYNLGAPLLLTYSGAEIDAANYVQKNGIEIGVILGGKGAVSKESELKIFGYDLAEKKYVAE